MKSLQKALKVLVLIIFILLAGIGIGLSGGVPLILTNRREYEKDKTELVEDKDDKSSADQGQVKQ